MDDAPHIEIEQAVQELETHSRIFQAWLDQVLDGALNKGMQIIVALAILFVGKKLLNLLLKIADRSMEKIGTEITVRKFTRHLLRATGYGMIIVTMLQVVGFETTSLITVIGSAGVAAGLAMQGSLSNFAGGILILIMKPFKVGDYIIQGDLEGTVSEIQMIYTYLLTPDNRKVVIPNGKLADNSLINVTAQEKRRLDIDVGISYTADLKKAKETGMKLLEREERVLKEEERLTVVSELADSAVILKLRFWVKPEDYWSVKWDMTEAVKLAFDAEGIEIPFNQVDVHIREE